LGAFRRLHHPDAKLVELRLLVPVERLLSVAGRVVGKLSTGKRHRLTDRPKRLGDVVSLNRIRGPELHRVKAAPTVWCLETVVCDHRPGQIAAIVTEISLCVELGERHLDTQRAGSEVVVVGVCVRVSEVKPRRDLVHIQHQELHLARTERAGDIVASREHLECLPVRHLGCPLQDRQVNWGSHLMHAAILLRGTYLDPDSYASRVER
jgi:hypothetical protein